MKSRTSFVSNSSSSSFICDICGEKFEDKYERSLYENGLLKSNQGIFCNKHVNISRVGEYIRKLLITYYYNQEDTTNTVLIYNILISFNHSYGLMKDSEKGECIKKLIEYIKLNTDEVIGKTYFYTLWHTIYSKTEIPNEICPIYNMDHILYNDLFRYLLINKDLYKDLYKSLELDIKKSFPTYKEFSKHLNEEN